MMSEESITVAARVLLRSVEFCRRRGHDPERLCRSVGLSYELLLEQRARIPFPLVRALGLRALALTGDEYFGLHLAEDVQDESQYDIGLLVLMASETLGDALDRVQRHARFWGDGQRVRFEPSADGLAIFPLIPGPLDDVTRHGHECALAEIVLGARKLCGVNVRPRVVRFQHRAPEHTDEHRRVFDCPLEFGARRSQLVFGAEELATPMVNANRAFLRVFERQLEETIARLPTTAQASAAVRAVAESALRSGGTDLARTARLLAMSERTLQRRLQAEGTSFAEILDSARREMALAFLARGLPLAEIAELLGYADGSAFHHAFKRWTGRAPTNFASTTD
jgi:AraC-like DNA-binding protein